MSGRGRGRGGGGGGGSSTVRAVANALGIARHEMGNFVQPTRTEAPPLYPPLQRALIPLEIHHELSYMADMKQEVLDNFQTSAYFLGEKEEKDIKRYTDKYKDLGRERLQPDFSRVPEELCWQKKKTTSSKAKKQKLDDAQSELISAKLKKLEDADKSGDEEEKEDEESENESEKQGEEAVSDDDYQEEDNDYVHGYFDNGEGYGEGGGSDDNMDGEEY